MTDIHDANDEEILLSFAVEHDQDGGILERYLRQYPHLAEQLIDLSLELRLRRATGETATDPTDEQWVEESLATLRAVLPVQIPAELTDPFAKISAQELIALRRELGVPSGVIQGFSSRLVDIASVPAWVVDTIASYLRSTADELRNFMAAPPRLAPGISYKVS
jgi:hypothetical protein